MNGEWTKEATTLELVTQLIDCKKTYVGISKSSWWRSPQKRWNKNDKLLELSQRSQAIAEELEIRYSGILWQMACRAKENGPLTDSEWENCRTGIWQRMKDSARTMTNYHRFSGVLWSTCSSQFGQLSNASSLSSLRPKFMLRQFVDEMPNSDARGLLRAFAFGESSEKNLAGKETLDALTEAFRVLHGHVLSRLDDLSSLTDDEIDPSMVRNIQAPFLEYRRWLFES